ncbi:hypothetical protein ACIBG8_07480 [Nonomuraea sp. NPDC050556]|uniref:hypothetical protein n=1 Tax=Nonomuraea sp. NPDC050556 TaxID=3364369 RepID=UPI0037960EE7
MARQCRRLLRKLNIKPPLDVYDLCQRFAEWREAPIRLVPWAFDTHGTTGQLLELPGGGHAIVYEARTSLPHQHHIIVQQLGRLIAEHSEGDLDLEPRQTMTRVLLRRLRLTLRPPVNSPVERKLAIHDAIIKRRKAELTATIILGWASVVNATHPRLLDRADPGKHPHLSLIHHQGWL